MMMEELKITGWKILRKMLGPIKDGTYQRRCSIQTSKKLQMKSEKQELLSTDTYNPDRFSVNHRKKSF